MHGPRQHGSAQAGRRLVALCTACVLGVTGLGPLGVVTRRASAAPPPLQVPRDAPADEPPPAGEKTGPPAAAPASSPAAPVPIAAAPAAAKKARRVRVTILPLPSTGVSENDAVTIQRDLADALRRNARLDMKDLDVRLAEFAQEMPFDQVELARTTYQNGRDALYKLETDSALAQLSDAVDQLVAVLPYIKKQELADAMMALAVAQMQKGQQRQLQSTLKRLLTWRPTYTPDPDSFPAQINQPLEKVRQSLDGAPQGQLSITSEPPGAQVFVDGDYVGVAPTVMNGLIAGEHYVTFKKLGYKRGLRIAQVTANTQGQTSGKLQRADKYLLVEQAVAKVAPGMGQARLNPVIDNLRETLFLDHGVFVRIEPRGTATLPGGDKAEDFTLTAFLYDLRSRTLLSTKTGKIRLIGGAPEGNSAATKLAEDVYEGIRYDGELEAPTDGGLAGTPPPRPLYKRWWFWTTLGVIVAGGAAALGVGLATRAPSCPDGHVCTGAISYSLSLPF